MRESGLMIPWRRRRNSRRCFAATFASRAALLSFICVLFLCGRAAAVTPAFVQAVLQGNTTSADLRTYTINFPDTVPTGNVVAVAATYSNGSGATVTVSDSASNSYSTLVTVTHSGGQDLKIFCGTASGANWVKVSWSNANATFQQVGWVELLNGTCTQDGIPTGTSGGSTTCQTSSRTSTVASDFVFHVCVQDGQTSAMTSWTAGSGQSNITWNIAGFDVQQGMAMQYGVQTAAGALAPQMTLSPSLSYVTAAVFLEPASSATGSDISGMHVRRLLVQSIQYSGGTFTVDFGSDGNLAVAAWAGIPNVNVNSISDGGTNTYTATEAGCGNGTVSGFARQYYSGPYTSKATGSGNVLTVTPSSSSMSGSTLFLYDITGAASSSPFDKALVCTTGTDTTGSFSLGTLTPTFSNEFFVGQAPINANTCNGTSTSGAAFDAVPDATTNQSTVDENNCWAHLNSSSSGVNFTFTNSSGTGAQQWAGMAAAYKSSTSAAACTPTLMLMGVGRCG
jgi:hypothetical protein